MRSHHQKTAKVAVLIETSTAYGRGLLRGIARFAHERKHWTLYLKPSGQDGALTHLKSWNVDGLLVRVHNRRLAAQVLSAELPAVDLGYVIPDLFPWRIANHQQEVGRVAAEHLLSRGLRHFAFCGWGPAHPAARVWENAREDSFRRTVADRGCHVDTYQWPVRKSDRGWSAAGKHLAAWLRRLPKPVGVMAANDERALEILDAAQRAGLDVPGQVALIGVDNDEVLCETTSPTLSSVALNLEQIGYEGASLLDRLLRRRAIPRRPTLVSPLGVVGRESTDVIAVDDSLVTSAVRLIHQRLHDPLQVADLLRALDVSRKTLELRFRAALGRTPYEEILRRRLEHVKQLLSQTDLSLKHVAQQAGFSHVENLHSVFRRELGQTPIEYRTRHSSRFRP